MGTKKEAKPTPGPFGALMCGCTLEKMGQYIDIVYCPMHGAADEVSP